MTITPRQGADRTDSGTVGIGRLFQRAAVASFLWALVFTAFHFYWFAGGRFGLGDGPEMIPETKTTADFVWASVITSMFVVGIVLPVALTRPWGYRIPRWITVCCLWTGAVLLVVRGGAGLLDTALRETGLADRGLTGLTYQEITGDAHPSLNTKVSGSCIDAYFVLGGLLYGRAALLHRRLGRAADLNETP
ncbi:hypothetical protein GCM10018980_76490 [Streptomyces capoamus]|uniref:DUF3995 domain-containing protein n=1 Tax=Streptomyces capoamus TaxID=68183 RepID=A0A919KGC9_9ACTN|nr:DUF3995 domain-containing protein [Streptomyces capoamus]GGW13126.1 hypothetical protein GCM10010501_15420 [Streptomyces libani subsp. rufus]GHG77916.1 hypothetical protein GCM10018980_76490 [Streptomyces capoamus]